MTDAELLTNPRLLLAWSASLDEKRQSFDAFVHQTEGRDHAEAGPFSSCADLAGFSIRVPAGPLEAA